MKMKELVRQPNNIKLKRNEHIPGCRFQDLPRSSASKPGRWESVLPSRLGKSGRL